ncbi:MAG: hypothetical protein Q8S39_13215 [Ignavibacteria bacterium]|nr:hypothetical protein [Ignavibacteria bacterium]
MSDQKGLICKDFENEIWLFTEQSLPHERIEFWNQHIQNCSKCSLYLKNELALLETCKEELSEDVLDSKFDMMINRAVKPSRIYSIKQVWIKREAFSIKTKFAMISGLAVVAIVISLITPRQNPVKSVSNELLDWEGAKINSQIDNVKERIEIINNDEWSNQLKNIDERLQLLESQADKF